MSEAHDQQAIPDLALCESIQLAFKGPSNFDYAAAAAAA
jgi:hypothetical protein